jgi:hypothetical protein
MDTSGFPSFVTVTNMINAEELWNKLRLREANIRDDLHDNQVLFMEHHTPTGETLLIDQVGYYEDAEAMFLVGTDARTGEECQVIAPPHTVQVLFRIATVEELPERKSIGFVVERADSANYGEA